MAGRRGGTAVSSNRQYMAEIGRRGKQPEEAVRPTKEAAAVATQTESEFLTHRSPELRNPLSVILGYSELMIEGEFGPLTDEQGQILERVRQNALELYGLITEMSNREERETLAR